MNNKDITNTTQTNFNKINKDTQSFSTSVVSLDNLLDEPIPEQLWLVDKYIPASAFTIISGQPSSYKTRFALDLALSLAKGEQLYGVLPIKKSGVLFIDEETGRTQIHRQLLEHGATKGLPIRISSRINFILNKESVYQILLECMAYELNTVIFDSLSHIHNANENDAPEMTKVLKHLQVLTEHGISVIVITHNRKEGQFTGYGGSEVRGSSAIFASADAQITLVPKGDGQLLVKPNKLRHARLAKPFELQVSDDESSFNFEYLGSVGNKESNKTILENAVLELLSVHHKLNQKEMLKELKDAGIKANDKNLPLIRDALAKKGKIIPHPGKIGNNKYYSLAPTTV